MALPSLFRFPDPVNEVSARLVAGGVVLLTIATRLSLVTIPIRVDGFIQNLLGSSTNCVETDCATAQQL